MNLVIKVLLLHFTTITKFCTSLVSGILNKPLRQGCYWGRPGGRDFFWLLRASCPATFSGN